MTLLRPGETCWRVETARRLAFLIDAQAYYAALLEALERATQSIWILGWAFDPRTRLAPDGHEGSSDPDEIGQVLIRLAKANPSLDVRVLIWKSTLSVNGSHTMLEHRARKAFRDTPVRYREDGEVPFGACHHQKVVVVDGEIAFCGGADITVNRWDTVGHRDDDPRRILPHRARHAPRHDVMVLVEGRAAAVLADLFRTRWARAWGDDFVPDQSGANWPRAQSPHLSDTPVAIARTEPAYRGRPLVDEILRLHLACIADAREMIYLENQYFTSHLLTDALARRLAEPEGPEVILVLTGRAPSWFDRLTMDPARAPLVRRLIAADRHDRFRAYAPRTAQGRPIVVHSKVSLFDDRVARIGSANLNNRAEGFDTECEVALEACDPRTRREIAQLRDVLLAHYLGVPEARLAAALSEHRRLIGAIEALNGPGRLRPIRPGRLGWWSAVVSACRLGDPAHAGESWRLVKDRRHLPGPPDTSGRQGWAVRAAPGKAGDASRSGGDDR
ncbi:phospholipase D-like domain-containing protein [Caulobacter sp. 602-1]|uniref:phospholipase D-like domain-containing protein n=1 Tax=Caulobacter sp. 602-1 TaxID=2492472 RepID=UPI000F62F6DE|nr:phospholipase D-like domain-containing protein [Caulobacter sp. 602-1]RRN63817.1 phospholipase [Caulobacter sp. 602-1]